jgi:hypothetical protein
MAMILKANTVNLFVYSVLFVFWYNLFNLLDTPRIREFRLIFEDTTLIFVSSHERGDSELRLCSKKMSFLNCFVLPVVSQALFAGVSS